MSEIKRWNNWCAATHEHAMAECVDGDYVLYADHVQERDTLARRVEWQPIETAPKDGSAILLWDAEREVAIVGMWLSFAGTNSPDSYEPAYSGWDSISGVPTWLDASPDAQPTHWMPLPAPPVRDEEAPHA